MPLNTTVIDDHAGVRTTVNTEDGDGKFHVHKKQNIQPILDHVKSQRNIPIDRTNPGRHVAEIPLVLAAKLMRDGILNDKKALAKWLDKPENKPFRVWEGRLT